MISVKDNVNDVLSFTDRLSSQYTFAVASALTATAMELREELIREQSRVFDRPTPFTQKGMFVRKATKLKLVAEVLLKDRAFAGTRSQAEILGHQYLGGRRKAKQIERYMQGAGLIGRNEYVVPSAAARLDKYGNISTGQVQQVMSQLKLGLDTNTWATKSARSIRNQKKAGRMFWSGGDQHLARGVWVRDSVSVAPLLMVTKATSYDQLIDVKRIGDKVFNRSFNDNLRRAFAKAKATAR